jgi:tetratricopeptide (TPR) repeat protein
MSPKPAIFISAVSCELKSARQLVANTLTFLGYEPDWQEIFGTEEGDLRALLRRRIEACKGVVQLVGQCYGAEAPTVDEQFGRVSYTQYEALYAKTKGKKVWYLFLDDQFPTDPHEREPLEKQQLQNNYRARLRGESHLYHPLGNRESLEASVLKLRDDLTRLRRGVRRWAAFVALLLLLSVGLGIWNLQRQIEAQQQVNRQLADMRAIITQFPQREAEQRLTQAKEDPEVARKRAMEELAKQYGLDPKLLEQKLPQVAEQLKRAPDATTYQRANAAYVAKDYNEAERLALVAADEAQQGKPPKIADAIKALELAAWSAEKRIEFAEAMQRLQEADRLTVRNRDPVEWARVQFAIACVLFDQGKCSETEAVVRELIGERERSLGHEHPDTLEARHTLAIALWCEGKYTEAEAEDRALIKLQEKVLGPENPDTLKSRSSLAGALVDQGKYPEAEAEDRIVITLRTKVLGPEHPDTVKALNNLAIALEYEGKYAEAEKDLREAVALEEKALGPEHPDTLLMRNNLAATLVDQVKYGQAEAEDRAVIGLREKALGPEHLDTLMSRHNLAVVLAAEGKYTEAEQEARAVIKLEQKAFGAEHPETLVMRSDLAETLLNLGKKFEAEVQAREVMKLEEKVLGPEHPDTLETGTLLANALIAEGKLTEGEAGARAVLQIQEKVLGAEHPDTLETRNSLAEALQAQGKYEEAETENRAVLKLREKVLGAEYPATLATCFNLARCLSAKGASQEAREFAQRAADGARNVLGSDHPDTKKYEQLQQMLRN